MDITITIYSVLSFFLFYIISKISYQLKIVDLPSKRKIHTKATACTGGFIISIILIISLELFELFNYLNNKLNLIFSIGFLISLIGLADDKYNLSAGNKLSCKSFLYLLSCRF